MTGPPMRFMSLYLDNQTNETLTNSVYNKKRSEPNWLRSFLRPFIYTTLLLSESGGIAGAQCVIRHNFDFYAAIGL